MAERKQIQLRVIEPTASACGSSSPSSVGEASPNPLELLKGIDPSSINLQRPVILINPKATYADEIAQKCFAPINLLLLAACLEEANIPTQVIDANAMRLDDEALAEKLKLENPLLIGVPVYAETLYPTARTIEAVHRACPNAKIVTGGPQASAAPQWMLRDVSEIDYVLAGDCERSLVDLVRYVQAGQNPTNQIAGLFTRDGGAPIEGHGPRVQDLDQIPFPARHLVKEGYEKKRYYALMIAERPVDSMITSRGCPHRCHFCYNVDTKMRFRSIDNCMEEIAYLVDRKITNIEILDDNFTAVRSRAIDFFARLKKEKFGITLRVKARADAIKDDMVKAAREAGVYNMSVGMESGSNAILKAMNKKITVDHLVRASEIVKKNGMDCHTGWILGYPGETPETISDTIDLIRKMKPTTAGIGILRPYPGTALYDQVKADGSLVGDWSALDPVPPWVKLPWINSYQEMVRILKDVTRKIYFRPYYLATYGKRILFNANWMMARYAAQEFRRSLPFSKKKLSYQSHAVDIQH